MRSHLKKIFDHKIGFVKLIVAIVGLVFGLSTVLISSELYFKVNHVLNKTADSNYLILNKKVSLISNTIFNSSLDFSENEVDEIKEKAFTKKIAPITSSNYRIKARSSSLNFRTDLFFESVPNEFLDVRPSNFKWKEGDELVPVIIPRDFVHLYNFGFAPSQGSRPISSNLLKTLTVDLELVNQQGEKRFKKGKIVALSDRIPTILVPQSFNEYMNKNFSEATEKKGVSRLLISVTNPSDPIFTNYLAKNKIETNNDKLQSGKVALIVNTLVSVLLFFGAFFIILSIIILLLVLELIITKSKENVQLLFQLGFTAKDLRSYFLRYVLFLLVGQLILSVCIFSVINAFVNDAIRSLGYEITTFANPATILVGIVFFILNVFIFQISLNKIFKEYH